MGSYLTLIISCCLYIMGFLLFIPNLLWIFLLLIVMKRLYILNCLLCLKSFFMWGCTLHYVPLSSSIFKLDLRVPSAYFCLLGILTSTDGVFLPHIALLYVWSIGFGYCAAGTLYMDQKLIYYTINLGGWNMVENGRKSVENRRK